MELFTKKELECKCGCGACDMQSDFMRRLKYARRIADIPFVILSGYRCEAHNAAVGGVDSSSHVRGYAGDIKVVSSTQRFIIMRALLLAGFTRIGVGRTFIHADCDPNKPAEVMCTYGKEAKR